MKKTLEQWITICSKIHNNKYDYSLWEEKSTRSSNKVKIICPVHGIFEQILDNHVRGRGCPACGNEKRGKSNRKNKEFYIKKSNDKHNFKYDYSLLPDFPKSNSLVKIICPIHGIFEQKIEVHTAGYGCQRCGIEQRKKTINREYGIASPNQISNKKSYDLLDDRVWLENQYLNLEKPTTVIAEELNVNAQTVANYLYKHKIDTNKIRNTSFGENELALWLEEITMVERNTRNIIPPKELDVFLPEYNIAIEYCGLFWHSEQQGKDKWYHFNKWEECYNKGILLLTIFEDEWNNCKSQVKNKILSLMHKDKRQKINARETEVVYLSKKQKAEFFNLTHIQKNGPSSINLGLIHNNNVVAAMGFIKHNKTYVLNRYATSARVVGGFSKLLRYFQNNFEWEEIISFADLRWSNGNLYESTGWKLDSILPPDYYYSPKGGTVRFHKFNYRKKYLSHLLERYDPTLSEKQNCDNNGVLRIWDCGKKRYVIQKNMHN